jgi:hypothetical protein
MNSQHAQLPMQWSIFHSVSSTEPPTARAGTWEDVVTGLSKPKIYASKKACPLLKLATFGTQPTAKGSYRHDSNVADVFGIEGDYDGAQMSVSDAVKQLRASCIEAVVYTTPSHKSEEPRWRVIAPLTKSCPPADRAKYTSILNGALGGVLAHESWTISQTFYFGRIEGAKYEMHHVEGRCLDEVTDIEPIEANSKPLAKTAAKTVALMSFTDHRSEAEVQAKLRDVLQLGAGDEKLRQLLAGDTSGYNDNHSQADLAFCSRIGRYSGGDARVIDAAMRASKLYREKWNRADYARRTIEKAIAKKEGDTRTVIRIQPGKLDKYAVECEDALHDELYVQGSALVRIGGVPDLKDMTGVRRDDSQAVTLPATTEYLRRRITARARLEHYNAREKQWKPIDCPRALAENIAQQKDWPSLRRLDAIQRAPFVRRDGSICETPGYDAESRIIYDPNADFPPIPQNPTRDDALRALDFLLAPFDEFPYSTEAARSAFVANILAEAVRAAIDNCPVFFYTAPSAGTGKTLIAKMPALIVHGGEPAFRPWSGDEEEIRKTVFSSLLSGDRTIGFDNLTNGSKVRSNILCAIITAPIYTDRVLGKSASPTVPNKAVIIATGNNLTPTGDMARRSLVIRLDANTARLRERTFRIVNLKRHVLAHRPQLLVAALTIIRAYFETKLTGPTPLPSFEEWSRFVRDPLLWLDIVDPVKTQADETDDDTGSLAETFQMLAESAFGANPFSAAELATAIFTANDHNTAAVIQAAGCKDAMDKQKLGFWLRDMRDRIAGNYKLQRLSEVSGTPRWQFLSIAPAPASVVGSDADDAEKLFGDLL